MEYNFPPERKWNMDESGVSNVQDPGSVVAEKGSKRVDSVTSGEWGKNTTLICAMNAIGTHLPPMFIFPRQTMSSALVKDGPAGSIYHCSPNGWSYFELFLVWLRHFQNFTQCSLENPVLLILDNHVSHVSLESYNFCRDNGIVMVALPPHTSHRTQPLDVSFFGPFKCEYRKHATKFIKETLGRINECDIPSLVNKAYCTVGSVDKGVSGFRATGIHPFNRNIFPAEDFIAAEVVANAETNQALRTVYTENLGRLFEPVDVTQQVAVQIKIFITAIQ